MHLVKVRSRFEEDSPRLNRVGHNRSGAAHVQNLCIPGYKISCLLVLN